MKKVIIADDRDNWREEYARVIKGTIDSDLEIDEVATGEELVERVLSGNYDLILTDYDMPPGILNGVEAVGKIRGAGVETPIYVISANNIESEVLAFEGTGYIPKAEADWDDFLEEKIKLHLGDQ